MRVMSTPSEQAVPGRLRLTGFAFVEVLLAVPTLLFFVMTVVGGVTAIAT